MAHGVVSELSAFFTVKPGYEEQLRAACQRFNQGLLRAEPQLLRKVGLRDMRHVIFDGGTRMLWITAFETDWDPYIDDALTILGLPAWADWLQYTVEYPTDTAATMSNAEIKAYLHSRQVKATSFFNTLSQHTTPEIDKALAVQQAFQQVLDDPAAAEALEAPALAPLLDQAAD
jgi:hypothetical protein